MHTQRIEYDDTVVRRFIFASVLFGIVGMLVGVLAASQLAWWQANVGVKYLTFSRIRPQARSRTFTRRRSTTGR